MEKSRLREKYLRLRKTLSSETISAESIKIANNSLSLLIWDYQYYHIFLPIENKNEVDTSYLLSILHITNTHTARFRKIIVPYVRTNNNPNIK